MRRSVVIAVLAGALVGFAVAAAISLAGNSSSSGSGGSSASAAQGSFASAYNRRAHRGGMRGPHGGRWHGPHGGPGFGPLGMAFEGLAKRLDVTPGKLREAIKGVKGRVLDRAVADGTITGDERDAIEACMKSRGGSGCDFAKARAAHRKLHRALEQQARKDPAALKSQLIGDLADELGKQPADVESAMRAELSDMLDKAVAIGFLTDRGRELALGCFDKPNDCDLKALRAEARGPMRGGPHGGRHHRGGPPPFGGPPPPGRPGHP